MIDNEAEFYDILRHKQVGIQVKIGRENSSTAMEDCSLISATYSIGEEQLGTIAILGPTRMQYSRVISCYSYLRDNLLMGLKVNESNTFAQVMKFSLLCVIYND